MVPTYTPSPISYGTDGIHYDLMSNASVQPVSVNGATPSYIDNFYYGYAGTVPLAADPTPTPTATSTPTAPATSAPSPTVPEVSMLAVIPLLIAVLATAVVIKHQKR